MGLKKYLLLFTIGILTLFLLASCNGTIPTAPIQQPPAVYPIYPEPAPPPDSALTNTPSAGSETGAEISKDFIDTPDTTKPELEGARVRVGTLRGPSGMGLAPLMEWAEEGKTINNYHFTLGGSPEEMTAGLISGELDIASVPTNVASVLYNRLEGKIQVLNVGTLGGLFILDATGDIDEIEDLRGRTLNITGQGGIPQFALEHILRQNGIEPGVDIEIIFNVEHSELAALMIAGRVEIGMLPQPFVTTVLTQSNDFQIAIGLTEAWEAANPSTQFVQGVVVARRQFIEEYPDAVRLFINDHYNSVSYVNENVDRAAVLMEIYEIIPAQIAARAIPYSNLVHLEGVEMKPMIEAVLAVLYAANPQAVGGAMPDEEFFFVG